LGVVLSSLPFVPTAKRRILKEAHAKWSRALIVETSTPVALELLDKLTVLQIFRGNKADAESLSLRSLELAENWNGH